MRCQSISCVRMQERASTTAGTNQKHPLSPPESDVARPLPDVRLHMMHVQFLAHPNKRLHLTPRHGLGVLTLVIYSVG